MLVVTTFAFPQSHLLNIFGHFGIEYILLGKHTNKHLNTPFSFVYGLTYALLNPQTAIAE